MTSLQIIVTLKGFCKLLHKSQEDLIPKSPKPLMWSVKGNTMVAIEKKNLKN